MLRVELGAGVVEGGGVDVANGLAITFQVETSAVSLAHKLCSFSVLSLQKTYFFLTFP
jgi:hypothetical protein